MPELLHKIEDCRKKAYKKAKKCPVKGCSSKSINSHILWKKGHIEEIAEDSHLYTIGTTKVSGNNDETKFKRQGINKILSFPGFCNKHDSSIFKQIEKPNVNFGNKQNQILSFLRALFFEIRKKERIIDWYSCILTQNLYFDIEQVSFYESFIQTNNWGIRDLRFFMKELNDEFYRPQDRFVIVERNIKRLPIAASGVFQVDSWEKMTNERLTIDGWEEDPLNNILFSMIPIENATKILFGYHTRDLASNLWLSKLVNEGSELEILTLINRVLVERIENWGCSSSFYETQIKQRETEILEAFIESPTNFTKYPIKIIDLFKDFEG